MSHPSRRAVFALPVAGLAAPALAQAYPTRPITMIVPFAAGGPTDTVARLIAQEMGRDMGGSVVVENVGGAGGTLGAQRVALARPDGYTVLCHHIGMGVIPTLYRRLSYDAVNGFETIGMITEVPMTIVGKRSLPAANLAELVALVRQRRDGINMANAGIGAASHLCGLLFQSALGVNLTTVPYRGTGPAMNDLVGGTVDLMCDQTTNTTGPIQSGRVKVFGATTKKRIPSLPFVPTLHEQGLKDFEVAVWHGLYAAKGTPKPVLDKLNGALNAAIKDQQFKDSLVKLGAEAVTPDRATPESLARHLKAEIEKWAPVIKAAGTYAD